MLLVNDARRPLRRDGERPDRTPSAFLDVEIAGLAVDAAQAVHARLGELRNRLNVYRGHVIEVGLNTDGRRRRSSSARSRDRSRRGGAAGGGAGPGRAPRARRSPRIATRYWRPASTSSVACCCTARPAPARPTRRATWSDRWTATPGCCSRDGRCTRSASVAELARDLQPAVIVLEDVDLVAEDRSFGPPASSPVLFDLLDAMDGAAADADLLFVLTTNRADLLEPALAARPGRVDVAIEIDLPDADARKRLLALYGRSIPLQLSEADTREIVERTDGVTASFLKELLRRAMLESLHDDPLSDPLVTAAHTARALDDLLDSRPAAHAQPARRRERPRDAPGRRRHWCAAAPAHDARPDRLRPDPLQRLSLSPREADLRIGRRANHARRTRAGGTAGWPPPARAAKSGRRCALRARRPT